jgi:hypothetical protein
MTSESKMARFGLSRPSEKVWRGPAHSNIWRSPMSAARTASHDALGSASWARKPAPNRACQSRMSCPGLPGQTPGRSDWSPSSSCDMAGGARDHDARKQ